MTEEIKPELKEREPICREQISGYIGNRVLSENEDNFILEVLFDIGKAAEGKLRCESILVLKGQDVRAEAADATLLCLGNKAELMIELPKDQKFELIIRPYITDEGDLRQYGTAVTLFYGGNREELLSKCLRTEAKKPYQVIATDDTFIFNEEKSGRRTQSYGDVARLHVRNTGNEDTELYRASYFKFTLSSEDLALLDSDIPARLRLFVSGTEYSESRKYYNMAVYAADTNWTENELNFDNHRELAATGECMAKDIHCEGGYLNIDISEYLKKQPRAADGSVTVSFMVTNEGHEDAIIIFMTSKESDYGKPAIEFGEAQLNVAEPNLPSKENVGFDPWGYGEMLADEWFTSLRDKIYPKDKDGNLLYHDELGEFNPAGYASHEPTGDFTNKKRWLSFTSWMANGDEASFDKHGSPDRYIRTLDTLGTAKGKPFMQSEYAADETDFDEFGGMTNAGFKGEATGFFHTEKHGNRTYIIDPLGNPYFAVGINTVCLGDSDNHKTYSLQKYGTAENYYKEITKSLKDIGFTITHIGDNKALLSQEKGLANVIGISMIGNYMRQMGRGQVSEGLYPNNNTINVFDPDFVKSAHKSAEKVILPNGYAEMPNLFGYTTDNEQPIGNDILDRYLLLDPNVPDNAFSYATAWAWVSRRMNCISPTYEQILAHPEHKEMNVEFLCFIYARYSKVSRDAIRASDPNHMYIGSRVFSTCLLDEGYLRAAGYYLDIITINLYGRMNPSAKVLTDIYRYSGKPFIVTEFYAKAYDAVDANGYKLANSCGAGLLVETQKDRADYYEHYVLALLESGGCVGWTWYRYRDNDQGLFRKKGTDNVMKMCYMVYGKGAHPLTMMDQTGKIFTVEEVGEYEEIYHGEKFASNQNVNKGIYTCKFNSMVTVYTYGADGELLDSMGYEVETPESETPKDGTVLKALAGDRSFTIGEIKNAYGGRIKTVLTVYEGKYIALAQSVRRVSNHLIGLVRYFDDKKGE